MSFGFAGVGVAVAGPLTSSLTLSTVNAFNARGDLLKRLYSTLTGDTNPEAIDSASRWMSQLITDLPKHQYYEAVGGLALLNSLPMFYLISLKAFSHCAVTTRTQTIQRLKVGNPLLRPLYLGFKDLCFLAYYRNQNHWAEIGYDGPIVSSTNREVALKYRQLLAEISSP